MRLVHSCDKEATIRAGRLDAASGDCSYSFITMVGPAATLSPQLLPSPDAPACSVRLTPIIPALASTGAARDPWSRRRAMRVIASDHGPSESRASGFSPGHASARRRFSLSAEKQSPQHALNLTLKL